MKRLLLFAFSTTLCFGSEKATIRIPASLAQVPQNFVQSIDLKNITEAAGKLESGLATASKNLATGLADLGNNVGKGAELKVATENVLKTIQQLDTTAERTVRDLRDISNNAQDGYERNLKKTAAAASCFVASSALALQGPSCCAMAVCCASSAYLFPQEAKKVVQFLMHNGSEIALAPTPITQKSTIKLAIGEPEEHKKKE